MDIRVVCPLGSECESVKNGYVERCAWYVEMRGTDASGEEHNEWKCAIAWQPILQIEVAGTNRQVSATVNKMHNENTERQNAAIEAIKSSTKPEIKVIEGS